MIKAIAIVSLVAKQSLEGMNDKAAFKGKNGIETSFRIKGASIDLISENN